MKEIEIIKKDGTVNKFDKQKIINAVKKSAQRVMVDLTKEDLESICTRVYSYLVSNDIYNINVNDLHNIVETTLCKVNKKIASSYREYRNYKIDFVHMLDEVYKKAQIINYMGDKENSNTDSCLVSTKRSLIYNELNKELYNKFFLTTAERQACRDGYIYIHDKSARRDTLNCSLFDARNVMKGGFEMGNMWYNEPKTIDTACDVLGDIIMMSASMQYGGWSTRVDNMLAEYCEKSYNIYYKEYTNNIVEYVKVLTTEHIDKAKKYAYNKTVKDLKQGIQGLEYKLNSVASSRGDYPFTTFAFGLDKSFWGREVSKAILDVRREGQGKEGFKRPVLFPKLVFLYDENLHGECKELEDVFMSAIECSSKCMYPDFLSMTGEGYVPLMYKEYGEVVYPMGCRAFLSPWFREGGMYKANENDTPVFTGRFNIGAVTLHLPMILQKSREENVDFYETLDFYLEMIRNIHKRTYDYLSKLRASTNPLGYCEGGFYGGNLKHNDTIESLLPAMTASFGITGLNEFEELYHQKSLVEDGQASLEVMTYINNKVEEFKKADGWLYAIYG